MAVSWLGKATNQRQELPAVRRAWGEIPRKLPRCPQNPHKSLPVWGKPIHYPPNAYEFWGSPKAQEPHPYLEEVVHQEAAEDDGGHKPSEALGVSGLSSSPASLRARWRGFAAVANLYMRRFVLGWKVLGHENVWTLTLSTTQMIV